MKEEEMLPILWGMWWLLVGLPYKCLVLNEMGVNTGLCDQGYAPYYSYVPCTYYIPYKISYLYTFYFNSTTSDRHDWRYYTDSMVMTSFCLF